MLRLNVSDTSSTSNSSYDASFDQKAYGCRPLYRPQLCLEWRQSDAARILMRLFEAYLFLDEIDKKETSGRETRHYHSHP